MIGSLIINYIRISLIFALFVPLILFKANHIGNMEFFIFLLVIAILTFMFFRLDKKTLLIGLGAISFFVFILGLIQ